MAGRSITFISRPNSVSAENSIAVGMQAKAAEFISCFTKDSTQLSLSEARYTVPTKPALAKEFVAKMPTMESFTEQVANARSRTGKLGDGWPKA